jgi:hypothetical protein
MPQIASLRRVYFVIALALLAATMLFYRQPTAQAVNNLLVINSVSLDRPTIHMLGVQMLISGDDNRNATVTVQYRPSIGGANNTWRDGPKLFRVLPETVAAGAQSQVPQQFAGTIFDLAPDTDYDIKLVADDHLDGSVVNPTRILLNCHTRPVPRQDPAVISHTINVPADMGLQDALTKANTSGYGPGTVIVIANGTYHGDSSIHAAAKFSITASGDEQDPIVIRGQSASGVILDGDNCGGYMTGTDKCNVLDVYGSYVHVENLTIRNADRALKFQGTGTKNNVARRLRIQNVVHGIGQGTDQLDFYISDNIIEGRLAWPWVLDGVPNDPEHPTAREHWDDRGIAVNGDGHVVCHNRISGFGDPIINIKILARSIDFYGNDILDSQDGTELDLGAGNVRSINNRFTNVAAGISLQPIYGGPAYVLRNVFLNVTDEQIKLKSFEECDPNCPDPKPYVGEPSGVLAYHNTFVSPKVALNLAAGETITGHNYEIKNNLFVGPRTLFNRAIDWEEGIDRGLFDYDGYFPDGRIWLGRVTNYTFTNFADLQAHSIHEHGGTLLTDTAPGVLPEIHTFAGKFVGPTGDGHDYQTPTDFNLDSTSTAIDRGTNFMGINQHFWYAAPDLGALESECPPPTYGPRPVGTENFTNLVDCHPQPSAILWDKDSLVGVTKTGNSITKTGAAGWNAGATSKQTLSADGYIEFTTNEDNTNKVCGLSHGSAGSGYTEIDYGLQLRNDGKLVVIENGTSRGVVGDYKPGDRFRVWVQKYGNAVRFYKNYDPNNPSAEPLYTSVIAPTFPLLVDTSLNTPGATITGAILVNITWGTDGVSINSNGDLTKTNTSAAWNAGAASGQIFSGAVEFSTAELGTSKACGMSRNSYGSDVAEIDYAIYLRAVSTTDNQVVILENGVNKGTFGTYIPGDRFRVEGGCGAVNYYKNGVLFHTTTVPPQLPCSRMLVDTSLYTPGATITDVSLSGEVLNPTP